jgi:hypothetical protein
MKRGENQMDKILNHRTLLLLVGLLLIAVASSACGKTEPQARSFDLEVAHGKLTLNPPVIKVNQDDQVTLKIRGNEEGLFHLHGYDLPVKVTPGQTAELAFTANATGKFDIEFHPESAEGMGGEGMMLGSLEVQPR